MPLFSSWCRKMDSLLLNHSVQSLSKEFSLGFKNGLAKCSATQLKHKLWWNISAWHSRNPGNYLLTDFVDVMLPACDVQHCARTRTNHAWQCNDIRVSPPSSSTSLARSLCDWKFCAEVCNFPWGAGQTEWLLRHLLIFFTQASSGENFTK